MPRNEIVDQIRAAVRAVTSQRQFIKWLKEEKVGDGLVLLNNSFIFRQKLQTIKSDLYLAIPVRTGFQLSSPFSNFYFPFSGNLVRSLPAARRLRTRKRWVNSTAVKRSWR